MNPYTFQPVMRARVRPGMTLMSNPFSYQWPLTRAEEMRLSQPSANIIRMENGYEIKMAVPGVPKNQIKIEVIENQLVISSTNGNQEEKPKYVRNEFDYTTFKRSFTLHRNADTAQMKAAFDQGILTITIPDKEPETRKIEII